MIRERVFIAVLFIAAFTVSAIGQSSTPANTVKSVLTYEYSAHNNALDQRNLNRYKKWITPGLYKMYKVALARQERYIKLHPTNKPYFGDGMDLSPLKENCTANGRSYLPQFSVGKANVSGRSATVRASFFFNKGCG